MQKAVHSTKALREGSALTTTSLIIKKTFDASHMLNDAKHAREVTQNSFGSGLQARRQRRPRACSASGSKRLAYHGKIQKAMKDVIKRKLMSNEFQAPCECGRGLTDVG